MRVREISKYLGIDMTTARKVSRLVHGKLDPTEIITDPLARPTVLQAIDVLIEGFGVESLWASDEAMWNGHVSVAAYVNTGDIYNATILWDRDRGYQLTTIGDWIEERERTTGDEL